MPSTCTFEFHRPDPVYYSGETIHGRIVLRTRSSKTVNEVYIRFEGKAKVRWEEENSRTQNDKTAYFTEYFRGDECYVIKHTRVSGEGELLPGIHTFHFSFNLPLQCPSSCVEKYGKIYYEISLVVDRSWRFNNEFKQPITVLHTYNLNRYPHLVVPIQCEEVKYFCCWPCSSGPVICELTIPYGGYAPGQKIRYSLEIDNQSYGYDLVGIEVSLIQTYIFQATDPRQEKRQHTNILASSDDAESERVLRLSKRIITGALKIPSVPPTSQNNDIIKVQYYVLLSIKTGRFHSNSELEVPITIGTIPLTASAEVPEHVDTWIPSAPDNAADSDAPPSYNACKPPPFEEATHIGEKFIDADVDEHNCTDDFIPKYPMYTNFAQPTTSSPPEATADAPLLPTSAPPMSSKDS